MRFKRSGAELKNRMWWGQFRLQILTVGSASVRPASRTARLTHARARTQVGRHVVSGRAALLGMAQGACLRAACV